MLMVSAPIGLGRPADPVLDVSRQIKGRSGTGVLARPLAIGDWHEEVEKSRRGTRSPPPLELVPIPCGDAVGTGTGSIRRRRAQNGPAERHLTPLRRAVPVAELGPFCALVLGHGIASGRDRRRSGDLTLFSSERRKNSRRRRSSRIRNRPSRPYDFALRRTSIAWYFALFRIRVGTLWARNLTDSGIGNGRSSRRHTAPNTCVLGPSSPHWRDQPPIATATHTADDKQNGWRYLLPQGRFGVGASTVE